MKRFFHTLLFTLAMLPAMAQTEVDIEQLRKLQTAHLAITNLYVDSVDVKKLTEDAIIGMLEKLDPHSQYSNPEETKKLNEPLEGNFEGIGVEFRMFEDTLIVSRPMPKGPSEKVGIVAGDRITLRLAPKGAGSENKGGLRMLVPADGIEGVKRAVLDIVSHAGASPCPPMVIGVGIGGNMELACLCAKKACARDVDTHNPDPRYARLEDELLELVNGLGIGPAGLGGGTTAFKVNVEFCATHIACLPVAVNINCHVTRHKTEVL